MAHRILHELASEANTEKFQRDKQQLAGNNTVAKIVLSPPALFIE